MLVMQMVEGTMDDQEADDGNNAEEAADEAPLPPRTRERLPQIVSHKDVRLMLALVVREAYKGLLDPAAANALTNALRELRATITEEKTQGDLVRLEQEARARGKLPRGNGRIAAVEVKTAEGDANSAETTSKTRKATRKAT